MVNYKLKKDEKSLERLEKDRHKCGVHLKACGGRKKIWE